MDDMLKTLGILFIYFVAFFFLLWISYLINPHSCYFIGC